MNASQEVSLIGLMGSKFHREGKSTYSEAHKKQTKNKVTKEITSYRTSKTNKSTLNKTDYINVLANAVVKNNNL